MAAEKARCQKQKDTDAATWKKEKRIFESICRLHQDSELRAMKDIFNKQFNDLKAALQPIKGEAMETDIESKLLKKMEKQSEIIISLR
uniref:Tubulin-specific chaperone A n=1 Tax=Strongyloides venezuelensis TaxID=75913 RepID=A0A0K0EYQ1_STRVS